MLSNECRFAQIRIGQARLSDGTAAGAWILFSDGLQRFFRPQQGGLLVGFDDVVHAQRGGEFGRLFAEESQLRRVGFDEEHGNKASSSPSTAKAATAAGRIWAEA